MKYKIRVMKNTDSKGIRELVNELPEWFDDDARQRAIPSDLNHQTTFVAVHEDRQIGFITLYFAEGRINIGWLAVRRNYHGKGIGRALLNHAEAFGRKSGMKEIATVTLGDGIDYEPYKATRSFYLSQGFEIYQRNTTNNPGCPEEIKIKKKIPEDV